MVEECTVKDGFEWIDFDSEINDPSSIIGANDDFNTFGPNGSRLRQDYYKEALKEYCRLLKERFQIDPEKKLEELKKKEVSERSSQESLFYRVLTPLVSSPSERAPKTIVEQEFAKLIDYEARYWDFISSHESLLAHFENKKEKETQEMMRIGRIFAHVRMVPRMGSAQKRLVHAYYCYLPEMTPQTFTKMVAIRNETFKNLVSSMKLSPLSSYVIKFLGEFSWCCYFERNPPNLRKIQVFRNEKGEERTVFNLRHSTPHNQSTVSLTYRAFLEHAAEKNQGVLYCVHQRLSDLSATAWDLLGFSKWQSEERRAHSIVELEKRHPNLLVLVQSVENDLFKCGKRTFKELKEALIDSFKQKRGICLNRLPHYLVKDVGEKTFEIDEKYERSLKEILDFVHATFFGKKRETISKEGMNCYGSGIEKKDFTNESQAFTMLFYYFQREHLKCADLRDTGYRFSVQFSNNGCKDNFDRGYAQSLVGDRVEHHQIHGEQVPPEDLEASLCSGQAPPIFTKGCAVLAYRVLPALYVSNLLATLKKERLEALQEISWNGWKLQGYEMV